MESQKFFLRLSAKCKYSDTSNRFLLGMWSARGLAHSIMYNLLFLVVLNKEYSMQNEALMSQMVPHVVPLGSSQQQEWSINGFLVHGMHYLRCNAFK